MKKRYNILGTGLLALDIILNGSKTTSPKIYAGGSCGNVLTILSYLGFDSYPISRLADNNFTQILLQDLSKWNVNTKHISKEISGSTPIIIHRIKKSPSGHAVHKFEFKNPVTGTWLPRFKPVLSSTVPAIVDRLPTKPNIFYFDRISRSSISLAHYAKNRGAMVYFEPSSYKDPKLFQECLEVADVIKFSKDRIRNFSDIYPNRVVPLEIETLGENGVKFRFKSDDWIHLEPYNFSNIHDSAGAGDWCSAGIISRLVKNRDLNELSPESIADAINFGQVLGGLNCYFDGARGIMYELNREKLLSIAETKGISARVFIDSLALDEYNKAPTKMSNLELEEFFISI